MSITLAEAESFNNGITTPRRWNGLEYLEINEVLKVKKLLASCRKPVKSSKNSDRFNGFNPSLDEVEIYNTLFRLDHVMIITYVETKKENVMVDTFTLAHKDVVTTKNVKFIYPLLVHFNIDHYDITNGEIYLDDLLDDSKPSKLRRLMELYQIDRENVRGGGINATFDYSVIKAEIKPISSLILF